jgi:hypothetical protein
MSSRSTDDWRAHLSAVLSDRGCTTTKEWAKRFPGEHCWFAFRGENFDSCACCGSVQRLDGKNPPCRGVVKVELR